MCRPNKAAPHRKSTTGADKQKQAALIARHVVKGGALDKCVSHYDDLTPTGNNNKGKDVTGSRFAAACAQLAGTRPNARTQQLSRFVERH